LDSMYNQYVEIAEIKEKEAEKQLLLEYKPEVAKANETIEKGVDEKIKVLPKINLNTAKRGEIKEYLSQILKPILDKPLRNTQGLQAYLNNASIDKMISDKAITKSVENGFSKQEHLEAVADIERLFSISKEAIAHSHRENNPGVIIHRLNAPFKESNALITTKESLDKNKNRIYSVELELTPRFNTSTRPTDIEANKGGFNSLNGQGGQNLPTIAKTDTDIIPQKTLKGDSITNPDISYAIKNENITKELAEKIANNAEIDTIIKRDDLNKAQVSYYDKDNMTMYSANIGNYIDDEFGMKGDKFFLNNVSKNEFYIPPTQSLQDFKEQSLNQIESLKHAIKTEIDNAKDEKELHKNIRKIKLKARENAERRFFDDALYKEQTQAREFYITQYDEAMQEMQNYYDKKFTNILNEIDFDAPTKQVKTQMLEALKPIFNQTMISSDGVQAYMSLKSLSKMTSPQAIQKSLDNGFSREEHLKAVLDIQRLFENAKLQATEPHKSGETNAIIHRLNSELENGNALITTKESLDTNKNRVYSLELELTPRFDNSSTPLNTKISEGGFNSQKGHQEQTIKAEPSIAKTDADIIPQQTLESTMQKFNYDEKKAKDLLEWHKDSS
ncbi:hypothetical protein, partial [Helicobacter bilis]|uniref:LPD3 domain-containing protein n=1 Tax=Helicobacter bilis TaxID=37372 RepID=UPI0018842433